MRTLTLIKALKHLYYEMVDSGGNWRAVPIGRVGEQNLTEDRIRVIKSLLYLVMNTSIVSQETRVYIKNFNFTANDVYNFLVASEEYDKSPSNVSTKIQADRVRLETLICRDAVDRLVFNPGPIEFVESQINQCYSAYSTNDEVRDNLILRISKNSICNSLSDEEWAQFMRMISPYVRTQFRFVQNNMPYNMAGYFNYLLSYPLLEGVDKERQEQLMAVLS